MLEYPYYRVFVLAPAPTEDEDYTLPDYNVRDDVVHADVVVARVEDEIVDKLGLDFVEDDVQANVYATNTDHIHYTYREHYLFTAMHDKSVFVKQNGLKAIDLKTPLGKNIKGSKSKAVLREMLPTEPVQRTVQELLYSLAVLEGVIIEA